METEADKASAVDRSTGDVIRKVPLNSLRTNSQCSYQDIKSTLMLKRQHQCFFGGG